VTSTSHRLISVVVAAALIAACGGDDADTDPAPTEATADDATGDEAPTDEPAGSDDAAESTLPVDAEGDDTDAAAAAFPVTIEHKYGETTIEAEPERVVSIGFAEHDGILALGVTPVGVRDWYGDQPYGTWPWAQDELGDAQPEVIAAAELNFEQIAAMQPDIILGIASGMSDSDYATLSAIAPTIAQPGEFPDYGTPWRDQLAITGRALGRTTEAEAVLAETEQLFADARAAHPEFEGATTAVAFTFEELPGAYSSNDIRSQVMAELGFVTPPEFDELAGDSFFFNVSQEELATLDTDVIIWLLSDESGYEAVRSMPLRPTLNAFAEGREVVADPLLSGAFSHASPLSLEYVVDELVPELALAVDGDPSTVVPSAVALDADPDAAGEFDDDQQAAADAWSTVFDSTIGFDDKAPYLESADDLRSTIEAYTTAGEAMGGISLAPTAVAIDGDTATITYDVYFGESAAYTALERGMTRVDGTWTVGRDEFCTFMASARNACPA
jgi:iron-siderophore transport system substrate-binding protein